MNSPISCNLNKGILRLTMDMPQKRNALSEAMMAALQKALDEAETNPEVRVIVLAAQGPAFCSGHDLKEMTAARDHEDGGKSYYAQVMGKCATLMQTIVNHPRPIIAQVEGIAAAAGCQLVASCDLAIAGANARFSTPGVHIGLFCSTPMVALTRNLSRKHAMEMLLTGDVIDANKAEQFGLINQVVDETEVEKAVNIMAEKIASKSMMTLQTGKSAFYTQIDMNLSDAYEYASQVMVENMMKNDAREGIGAFVEKRDPKWSDS